MHEVIRLCVEVCEKGLFYRHVICIWNVYVCPVQHKVNFTPVDNKALGCKAQRKGCKFGIMIGTLS